MIPAALSILVVSAATSLLLTPAVRELARWRGWLDHPDGWRKLHGSPVPRLGGVAVFASFALSLLLLPALSTGLPGHSLPAAHLHLLLACAAVMAVGLADDLKGVRPHTKLGAQAAAGVYLYFAGYDIAVISVPFADAPLALGVLSLPLTVLWFVGVSNAFNLIDGLDGLAAGIGLFATTTLFVAAVINGRWEVALLAAALAGALLGFLRYNLSPATIFLGDSGALFVGLALAGLAVRGNMKSPTAITVAAPLLALGVPLLDTGIAVLRRLLRRQRVFDADGDHIHHRMLRRGLEPSRVVMILYAIAALFSALSLLSMTGRGQVVGVVVIATCLATWIGIAQLGYGEAHALQRLLPGAATASREGAPDSPSALAARFEAAASGAELWEALTGAARRLGFGALRFEPAGMSPPPGFDEWRHPALAPKPGRVSVVWNVPLSAAGRSLGTLVFSADPAVSPSGRDGSALLEVLSAVFAPRLDALLRCAARVETAPRPRLFGHPALSSARVPGGGDGR